MRALFSPYLCRSPLPRWRHGGSFIRPGCCWLPAESHSVARRGTRSCSATLLTPQLQEPVKHRHFWVSTPPESRPRTACALLTVEPWRPFWGFFKAPTGGVTSGSTCDTVSEEMRQEEEGGVAPHELVEDKRRWKFDFACGLLPCVNISSHAAAETRQSVTAAPPATTEPLTLSLLVFSASPLAV